MPPKKSEKRYPQHKGISFAGYYDVVRKSGARDYVLRKLNEGYGPISDKAFQLERELKSAPDDVKAREVRRLKTLMRFINQETAKVSGGRSKIPVLRANLFKPANAPKKA